MTTKRPSLPSYPNPHSSPAIELVATRLVARPAPAADAVGEARRSLRTIADAAAIVRDMIGHADREHFVALYIDVRLRVTHAEIVSVGTLTSAMAHPREVFKGAIVSNADRIVLAHNHPSGDLSPSEGDVAVTDRMVRAGELLGIEVLDSIIVGPLDGYRSIMHPK
jgi:DNA repair protein RadC